VPFTLELPALYLIIAHYSSQGRRAVQGRERRSRPGQCLEPRAAALYRVWLVGPWRYGLTLLPGASRPDDERDEGKVDEVLRARSESGWELVNAVTERDGSDVLVFRRLAD
jgi:hypothetical protein